MWFINMGVELKYVCLIIVSYVLGCFCGAYYYGTIFLKKDIRIFGSGNLGALNSGRVLGKKAFVIVLFIDILKGILAVEIGQVFFLIIWNF